MMILDRRKFLKRGTSLATSLGLGAACGPLFAKETPSSCPPPSIPDSLPEYPLVFMDNFHHNKKTNYSLNARMQAAKIAGYDGFEFVCLDPRDDEFSLAMELSAQYGFSLKGIYWLAKGVIDADAGQIGHELALIDDLVYMCRKNSVDYITLALKGNAELMGEGVTGSGSAQAQARHWERAAQIVSHFDRVCQAHQVKGSLYGHAYYIADTPQAVLQVMQQAQAHYITPAFTAHHWYANERSESLDEVFSHPAFQRSPYAILSNISLRPDGRIQGQRFDQGDMDMAWMLAKLIDVGFEGHLTTHGWGIGGDPFAAAENFVVTVRSYLRRFREQPELWPLL